MNFKENLMEEIKQAMRDRNAARVGVLRFLLSEIKTIEIDAGELSDQEIQKVISRQVKQIQEAVTDYQKAGREDLVAAENEKAEILKEYLPAQLSDDELGAIVEEIVAANEEKNMGKIIGQVMQRVQGKADGSRVAVIVKEKLQ